MHISRRDFLKYVRTSVARLGLVEMDPGRAERALAATAGPPVLWLRGSACTGCSVALLDAIYASADQALPNTLGLRHDPNLMAPVGDLAVAAARSTSHGDGYVLVVEGAIPTGGGRGCCVWDEAGRPVTMAEAVTALAARASCLIAVGTCASYGGIPAAYPPATALGLGAFLGRDVVNLPGCPAHSDRIIGTLVRVLCGEMPALDRYARPTVYYSPGMMHQGGSHEEREEAGRLGRNGLCLKDVERQGPGTDGDGDLPPTNNGQEWCIGANGPYTGCTEPGLPGFPPRAVIDD